VAADFLALRLAILIRVFIDAVPVETGNPDVF
jgi:hypothetical protein